MRFFHSYVVLLFLTTLSILPLYAGGMELKTTTDLNSAEICRRLKEGPSITDSEVEDDKKRKVLGIGEIVVLELIDNSDEKKVEWEYLDPSHENFAELKAPLKGKKTIRLTVQKNLKEDASVGIKVTNEFGESREVSFELKIPSKFEGENIPGNGGEGTVPEIRDKDGNIVALQPGQTGTIGAAGELSVKMFPMEVSFSNIRIVERANDPPRFLPAHKPNPNPQKMSDTNEFGDTVSAFSNTSGLPKGWTWNCSWKLLHDDGQDGIVITGKDVLQTVSFQQTGKNPPYGVKTTIDKFDCTVSRDSLTGEYEFETKK